MLGKRMWMGKEIMSGYMVFLGVHSLSTIGLDG